MIAQCYIEDVVNFRLSTYVRRSEKKRARAWVQLGNSARAASQWSTAEEHFLKALAITPSRPDIWVQVGHMRKEQSSLQGAIDAYKAALSYDETYLDAYVHAIRASQLASDGEGVKTLFRAAVAVDSTNVTTLTELLSSNPFVNVPDIMSGTFIATEELASNVNCTYNYSIVSACYNVAEYIDAFIGSIINQTASRSYIELILVDDGSTDETGIKIQEWKNKFPGLITYICQKNAGQAAARNTGMNRARGQWVTFIDPDDAIYFDYIEKVDKLASEASNKKVDLICGRIVYYKEADRSVSTNHPLDYRFSKGSNRCAVDNSKSRIQLSASSAFFRLNVIKGCGLKFAENIKPTFEDAVFVNDYLMEVFDGEILFIDNLYYLYRKRERANSTLDMSWSRERFVNQIETGSLSLARKAIDKFGRVPRFISDVLIYEISFTIRKLVNDGSIPDFLNQDDVNYFLKNLEELLNLIGEENISHYAVTPLQHMLRVGMIGYASDRDPLLQFAYIDRYDAGKNEARLYFYSTDRLCAVPLPDIQPIVASKKIIEYPLLGGQFVFGHFYTFKCPPAGCIEVTNFNGSEFILNVNGKRSGSSCDVREIRNVHVDLSYKYTQYNGLKGRGAWLLMDRDVRANDNAEHFYRYLRRVRPEQSIYFAISKLSSDWARLSREGFNLIAYDTDEYYEILKNVDHLISSHVDDYVFGGKHGVDYRKYCRYRFTFLQHGVNQNDVSAWLNKKDIDNFVVTSAREFNSIVDGRYVYTAEKLSLAGFARHDRLNEMKNIVPKDRIMIMPTWRKNLVGRVISAGNSRERNPDFIKSSFYRHWNALLNRRELEVLARDYELEVCFMPHTNIVPYINDFDLPDFIKPIDDHCIENFQDELLRAKILVTDYSSVAFDAGYQGSEVFYYQFDRNEVLSGEHIFRAGYFDYVRDGFGPVCESAKDLVECLGRSLCEESADTDLYRSRVDQFFYYRDNNNCQRILDSIDQLTLRH